MQNKKRLILGGIISLLVLLGIGVGIFVSRTTDEESKTIQEVFTEGLSENYAKEIHRREAQSVVVDEYTVTLEESLYDAKTAMGHAIFSISTKNDTKIEIQGERFGENTRFGFLINITSGGPQVKYIEKEDTLYAYINFAVDNGYEGTISLLDYSNHDPNSELGVKEYIFELEHRENAVEFVLSENTTVQISQLGLVIDTKIKIDPICITVGFSDGKEKVIVDTANKVGIGGSGVITHQTGSEVIIRQQFVFTEFMDIDEIDYIVINGARYEK